VDFVEHQRGEDCDTHVSKAYSVAFKQRMVTRLIGKNATSANRLAQETGVSQEALSRWRREAGNLGRVGPKPRLRKFTPEQKIAILAAVRELEGEKLTSYLEREEATPADLERWRLALDEDGTGSLAATKRIKALERELARKEKALAEAAALLILKKKLDAYFSEGEDDGTDEETEK
jgi:transposase-like protein